MWLPARVPSGWGVSVSAAVASEQPERGEDDDDPKHRVHDKSEGRGEGDEHDDYDNVQQKMVGHGVGLLGVN